MKTLTIYLTNGATFRFENVSNYEYENSIMKFDYISASTGKDNTAVMKMHDGVLGYSIDISKELSGLKSFRTLFDSCVKGDEEKCQDQ